LNVLLSTSVVAPSAGVACITQIPEVALVNRFSKLVDRCLWLQTASLLLLLGQNFIEIPKTKPREGRVVKICNKTLGFVLFLIIWVPIYARDSPNGVTFPPQAL